MVLNSFYLFQHVHTQHYYLFIYLQVLGDPSIPVFSSYIKPKDSKFKLTARITSLTGITTKLLHTEGIEFEKVYESFQIWLREASTTNIDRSKSKFVRPIVFIAHNSDFDVKFLNSEIIRNGFREDWCAENNISGFVDSLKLVRNGDLWLDRGVLLGINIEGNKQNKQVALQPSRFSLGVVHSFVLGCEIDNAHNAVGDIMALENILESSGMREIWRKYANKIQYKKFQ